MTDNLAFELESGQQYKGSNNVTGEEITFTADATILNGSTKVGSGSGSYANQWYYNWYAAIANTPIVGNDATGSICPKGWRLPAKLSSNAQKSFGAITREYLGITTNVYVDNSATLTASPISLVLAGNTFSFNGNGGPMYGDYWTTTSANSRDAYMLRFYTNSTLPEDTHYKETAGLSVRCVAV